MKKISFLIILFISSCSSNQQNLKSDAEIVESVLKSNTIPKEVIEEFKESPVKKEIIIKKHKPEIKSIIIEPPTFQEQISKINVFKIPFKETEKIRYKVKMLGITIGEMEMSLSDGGYIKERKILIARSQLKSTGLVGKIYNIRQNVKSSIDKEKIFSYKYEIEGTEGNLSKSGYEIYDSENLSAYLLYRETKKDNHEKVTHKKYSINQFPQDLLSIFYYIRTIDFNQTQIPIRVIAKDHEKTGLLNIKLLKNDAILTMSLNSNSQGTMDYRIILNKDSRIIQNITLNTKIGTLEMSLVD